MEAIAATGTFDLGGVVLEFSDNDSQGMNDVYMTAFKSGEIVDL